MFPLYKSVQATPLSFSKLRPRSLASPSLLRRRDFITGLLGLMAWLMTARARSAGQVTVRCVVEAFEAVPKARRKLQLPSENGAGVGEG